MGLNKRFLSEKSILSNIDNLMKYLESDIVYLTDDFSKKVYNFYIEGKSEEFIIKQINIIKK
jgi:hypothetical protein